MAENSINPEPPHWDDDPIEIQSTWVDTVWPMMPSLVSLIIHTIVLLILGLVSFKDNRTPVAQIVAIPPRPDIEDPPVEVELNPKIDVAINNIALFESSPAPSASPSVAAQAPVLDTSLAAKADVSQIRIDSPTIGLPDSMTLIEAVPDANVKGESRDIVDSYQEALDRLAQELIWMLDKGPVLAIWCFDQSGSMKDDQQEIRDRIETVYEQIGLVGRGKNDALLTAVTSFGESFLDHTQHNPTSDRDQIRSAIDSVPVDESGRELMCAAVGTTINTYRDFARRRQIAVILVTDESGDRPNNDQFLEEAILAAKSTQSKVYVLGRESVFGYPLAYIRWLHPQTNRTHWLPIDRGPETAFPEQLQTNGFRRRHDAFSSGFGPYEQARMARETNGIFFMLPSRETNLVGEMKVRYDMEALRPYRPDLRAKEEVLYDRGAYPLRSLIWQVIQDLNPLNEETRKAVELQMRFPSNPNEFVKQARQAQTQAKTHLRYMAEAEARLLAGQELRSQEVDPRWQANYDLILAQLVAYQARTYEYGVAFDAAMQRPAQSPGNNRVLAHWDIRTVDQIRTEEAKTYADRARSLFAEVQVNHPGSPWSARAENELGRGFGVDLRPAYRTRSRRVNRPTPRPPAITPIKPPKL